MLGGEIDVDVGCARHLFVQEALEQQVVLDGVDPCDAEHIGDDRVSGRTTSLSRDAFLAGETHEVPADEKELCKSSLLDHLELVLQAMCHCRRDGSIALAEPIETELVEERKWRFPRRHRVAGKSDFAEVEVDVALLRYFPRRRQRLTVTFEEWAHLSPTFEVMLGVREEVRARFFERGAMPDGDQHVMQPAPGGDVVVDLVGRYDSGAAACCHRRAAFEDPLILSANVVMYLAEDVLRAQRFLQPSHALLAVGGT